jgi:uncharacterized membrane protein YjjP (DUF1212 family)
VNRAKEIVATQSETEEVAHLSLLLGRLLLASGADTGQVQEAVVRFAAALGCEARLLVTYEALLLTLVAPAGFRTKIGHHVPAMNVDMSAVGTLNRIVSDVADGTAEIATAANQLTAAEHPKPVYPRWLTAIALGLTAASLAKLFGGGWSIFFITLVAGATGTLVRQQLGRMHTNPLLTAFVTALTSGVIGGLGITLHSAAMSELCLVAPAMVIVPGVPLINGIRDAIKNYMSLSVARLGFASLVVLAIAFGLFGATIATGVSVPVSSPTSLLSVPEDGLFSALAALGYALLFNVPGRIAWAGILCGMCSHTLRTFLLHFGVDVVAGTLIGSLASGFLAHAVARRFQAPPATFAFPGVVAMVPGSYAFHAVMGSVQIMQAGSSAAAPLVADTLGLVISCILMTAAIAIGLAIPLSLPIRVLPEEKTKVG